MRILVTGGAGFIGSHLCRKLLAENNRVICIDNFYTGSAKNVSDLMDNKNFELIEHDVSLPIKFKVNRIYNLACPASPIQYQRDPVQTFKISVLGAMNMLELARSTGACILQTSTSEVYGDPEVHPQPESYWGKVNPIGIRSCYDEGKRAAETLFYDYKRKYETQVRIVRIFNTYGPNMDIADGRVVSNFIVQALQNLPLTIYGDGSQTRSFQYIDDLVEGMILMMENQQQFCGPVNLGNPEEFTVLELAKKILQLIPESQSKIAFQELPSDDPRQRKPNIDLAYKELSWKPSIPLESGLRTTIEYFRRRLGE